MKEDFETLLPREEKNATSEKNGEAVATNMMNPTFLAHLSHASVDPRKPGFSLFR